MSLSHKEQVKYYKEQARKQEENGYYKTVFHDWLEKNKKPVRSNDGKLNK